MITVSCCRSCAPTIGRSSGSSWSPHVLEATCCDASSRESEGAEPPMREGAIELAIELTRLDATDSMRARATAFLMVEMGASLLIETRSPGLVWKAMYGSEPPRRSESRSPATSRNEKRTSGHGRPSLALRPPKEMASRDSGEKRKTVLSARETDDRWNSSLSLWRDSGRYLWIEPSSSNLTMYLIGPLFCSTSTTSPLPRVGWRTLRPT
mmetsp:Transcript_56984/g.156525  ORF Transcript_56984/g.156525 Transcript_56984/m.156525 type:complete len:210 (-) Transcript_56984:1571-2200(-)